MSNAASFSPTSLTASGGIARPAPAVLDTGTDPVTISMPYSQLARVLLEFKNTAAADLTVAWRDDVVGEVGSLTLASGATGLLVPPGRRDMRQPEGNVLRFVFTPASGTIGAEIIAFRLPKNV